MCSISSWEESQQPHVPCVRFLQRYVQKETESMQSSRATVTAAALAARQKKMAEICSLIKYFIRYANKRKTDSLRYASRADSIHDNRCEGVVCHSSVSLKS